MSLKDGIALTVVAASLLLASYLGWKLERSEKLAARERDQRVAVELERDGMQKALQLKPKEVVKLVETIVPKEVVKLIHDKEVIPVNSVKIETRTIPIELPCNEAGIAKSGVSVEGAFLLAATPLGKPFWTKKLFVHVVGLKDPVDFSDDSGIQVGFSEEISKLLAQSALPKPSRLALLPRGIRQWCAGWSLGVGLCQPILGASSSPSVCGAFLWGVQL